jgi:L-seryl-tRNA(Ser) seleniumtransferase
VHTNLGRVPLGCDAIEALVAAASNYTNLEYSLTDGARGGRATYVERGLALLCGAEAAMAVNNNAAALVLILRHFCRAPVLDVVISRGELVQIGGGFRIPDVLESSGARLHEVGTTNQTSVEDYARAITPQTALILKVHRSNFFMDGFVESPSTGEIAALARRRRVPFVEDLGSGAIVETQTVEGLEHEPTPAEAVRRGVDLVCFSGDKLILSALEATVEAGLRGGPATPVVAMMRTTIEDLRLRAQRIVEALDDTPLHCRIAEGRSQMGGGTLPRSELASITLRVTHDTLAPQELASRLRLRPLPLIGRVARGALTLDLRTIFPRQDEDVVAALRAAAIA